MRKILRTVKIGQGRRNFWNQIISKIGQHVQTAILLLIIYIASQLLGIAQSRWLDIGIVLFLCVYGPRRQQR